MKLKSKILIASAFIGAALSEAGAQTVIPVGNQALLAGYDFNNILGSTVTTNGIRARYSDVFGNNSSPTALTAPGGIFANGTVGSDNFGSTIALTTTEDIDRDILTRTGTGSTFDLGGQTGGGQALLFNNSGVGTTFDEFSINVKMLNGSVNSFKDLTVLLSGRDVGNTAGGVTINWAYSIDGGATKLSTGLSTAFTGNVFAQQTVDFSSITALNGVADVYLIGQIVESQTTVQLSLDNIGIYGVSQVIPEPSTYAAILGALTVGFVSLRRRFKRSAV
jgi:hypothetical protein